MRLCYVDNRTYSCAESVMKIARVYFGDMTYPENTRDVFVRALRVPSCDPGAFFLCSTLAEAEAITGDLTSSAARIAAGVLAYKRLVLPPGDGDHASVVLTNQSGTDPDLTGVTLRISGGGNDSNNWDCIYGYISSPSAMILDMIDYYLGERMGDGQSLDGFTASRLTQGPTGLEMPLDAGPAMIASIATDSGIESNVGEFGIQVDFTIIVARRDLSDVETATKSAILAAGNIRSILGDEERTFGGAVLTTNITEVEGAEMIAGPDEPYYIGCRISGSVILPSVNSDRV